MAESLDSGWRSCEIAEHIEMHNGDCFETGREDYCIECPYRNPLGTDTLRSIDIRYEASSGLKFSF